ncbi:UDP-glucose/GDP-mannose dehydrogenase family protein, partial [Telmatospirillum sp.]
KIRQLNAGIIPIYEPGLEHLVKNGLANSRLRFTTESADAVAGADAVFIAVGTPSRRGDGHADMVYVHAAAEEIAPALDGFTVVVNKSTVPVGTGDEVERIIRATNPDADFAVVSNPEFLREGAAIDDFKRPDRVVIGGDNPRGLAVMREVYRPLVLGRSHVVEMSRRSAELSKYASNAFLAAKIAFINEIADLCEKVGADVSQVANAMGMDNRIGAKFLHAGPGFGGSCFPKDTLALLKTAEDFDTPQRIVEAVVSGNERRKRAMGRKIIDALGGDVRDRRIAILGLTFKPNTDDMREAPSIAIIQALQDAGARVHAHDPAGMEQASRILPDITCHDDPYEAMEGAEAVAIVTEWDAFRALDLARMKQILRRPILIDLRNIYPRAIVEAAGLSYFAVGR